MPMAKLQQSKIIQRKQAPGTTSQTLTGSNEVLLSIGQLTDLNSQSVDASN